MILLFRETIICFVHEVPDSLSINLEALVHGCLRFAVDRDVQLGLDKVTERPRCDPQVCSCAGAAEEQ